MTMLKHWIETMSNTREGKTMMPGSHEIAKRKNVSLCYLMQKVNDDLKEKIKFI